MSNYTYTVKIPILSRKGNLIRLDHDLLKEEYQVHYASEFGTSHVDTPELGRLHVSDTFASYVDYR